jgi:DNA-binding transcriptional ArsR family regulator
MENSQTTRGGSRASSHRTFNKKQFVQYEPELVAEMNDKKSSKQSVSGRLLTLIYKRLVFWSRYAKHQHNGRRYFWKSISELSEELQYSEKQVSRGLRALLELGMIIREKLNKRNWKHTYYYYLPHSVHTKELGESAPSTTTTRSRSTRTSESTCSSRGTGAGGTAVGGSGGAGSTDTEQETQRSGAGTTGALRSPCAPASGGGEAVRTFPSNQTRRNVPFITRENNPLLNNQLRVIVEKCMDYGKAGIKPITKGGVGFAT